MNSIVAYKGYVGSVEFSENDAYTGGQGCNTRIVSASGA